MRAFSSLLILLSLTCAYRPSAEARKSMLVVYATGSVFVKPEGKEEVPARAGMILHANDGIRTEDGTVDLQSSKRAAVRVREFTEVVVADIQANTARFSLRKGALLAKVPKENKDDSFIVRTPTAVAGVRGTVFSVTVGDNDRSQVRVLEGAVSLAPHIPVLEGKTPEQIQSDPLLKKLAAIQAREAVIEQNMQGRLSESLEKSIAENRPAETAAEEKPIIAEKTEMPALEVLEARTLVTVNPELIDRSIDGKPDALQQIEQERETARERVLEEIKSEVSAIEMKTEEEIRKRYSRLELITLRSGETIRGAVIAQTGNTLLVHTTSGVKKIPRPELLYQEPL